MNPRLLLSWVSLGLLIPAVVGLIYQEDRLEPAPPVKGSEMLLTSPLVDMVFTKEYRENNFMQMGLKDEMLVRAMQEVDHISRDQPALAQAIARADLNNVSLLFCRQNLPVIYRAAGLLVSGVSGSPDVVSPFDKDYGQPWDAFPATELPKLFERWEKRKDRVPEDTLIALSALLLGRLEQAIGAPSPPFDRLVSEGGKFGYVAAQYGSVQSDLIRYAAYTHAIAEIVHANPTTYGCADAVPVKKKE